MAKQVITFPDVSNSMVNQVVSDFKADGATVTKTQNTDGTWTVVATYS
jgi:hypothetical protein